MIFFFAKLLAMMAARAGADFVAAVEKTPSMVDAGEENVCMNGLAHKVLCLNRDVRRVFTKESQGLQPVPGALPGARAARVARPLCPGKFQDCALHSSVFKRGFVREL